MNTVHKIKVVDSKERTTSTKCGEVRKTKDWDAGMLTVWSGDVTCGACRGLG